MACSDLLQLRSGLLRQQIESSQCMALQPSLAPAWAIPHPLQPKRPDSRIGSKAMPGRRTQPGPPPAVVPCEAAASWERAGRGGKQAARAKPLLCKAAAGNATSQADGRTRLIVPLGKGGVGKTTAAVLLAKFFSSEGLRTILAVQSVDREADRLLQMRIPSVIAPVVPPSSPSDADPNVSSEQDNNLGVIRLETTKLLLEPLAFLKRADAKNGWTQGALEEVVGEELSVLPGMDAIVAAASLERFAQPAGGLLKFLDDERRKSSSGSSKKYPWGDEDPDVVVYDGPGSAETLRVIASPQKSRWYLKRFRELAERTDIGRVALPTAARIAESVIGQQPQQKQQTGGQAEWTSSRVWLELDKILARAVDAFQDPQRLSVFLVTDGSSQSSIDTSARLWGCTLQAGASVAGILSTSLREDPGNPTITQVFGEQFSPLPVGVVPSLPSGASNEWKKALDVLKQSSTGKMLLERGESDLPRAVKLDATTSTVILFLPGFDKSEVKLQQWKNGSELLVDVGDQRQIIELPPALQGKVVGAKFDKGFLRITMK